MQEGIRICRKCLLEEMDEEAVYADLRRYIEQIPDEERTEEVVYRERLEQCKMCDQLLSPVRWCIRGGERLWGREKQFGRS